MGLLVCDLRSPRLSEAKDQHWGQDQGMFPSAHEPEQVPLEATSPKALFLPTQRHVSHVHPNQPGESEAMSGLHLVDPSPHRQ